MAVEENAHFNYALIIETDQYTGNFERELCAYATGAYGECEVGKQLADIAREAFVELGYDEYAISSYTWNVNDDHGCGRPVSIWNGAGNTGYHDLAIFLEYPFTPAIFELVKSRVEEFAAKSRERAKKKIDWRDESADAYRLQCRGGDLHIKKMYMIKRTVTIVDEPQEPLEMEKPQD